MRVRLSAPFVWTNWCVGLLGMTLNVHTSMCTCSGEQGIRMRGAKWPDKEVIKIVCPFYTTHTYLLIYVEGFKKKIANMGYLSFFLGLSRCWNGWRGVEALLVFESEGLVKFRNLLETHYEKSSVSVPLHFDVDPNPDLRIHFRN